MYTWGDVGQLIYARLRLRNPIVGATIAAQVAGVNGTSRVTLKAGGAQLAATFAPPRPVEVGGAVWATKPHPHAAEGIVLWTNYQGGGGLGTGALGTGPLGGGGTILDVPWGNGTSPEVWGTTNDYEWGT